MKNFLIFVLLLAVIGLATWTALLQGWISAPSATGTFASTPSSAPSPRGPVAFIQVEPRQPAMPLLLRDRLADSRHTDAADWSGLSIVQRTQANILSGEGLLSTVVADANSPIRQTQWFKSMNDPRQALRWLKKHFIATPIADSALIKVYFDELPFSRTEAAAMIEAIVDRHFQMQQQLRSNQVLDRTTALNNLKIKYETRIRELQDRQNNRMMQLNIGAVGSPNRYTAIDVELQGLMNKRMELDLSAMAAQARLEELNQRLAGGTKASAYSEAVERDPIVLRLRERLLDRDIELRSVATTQPAESASVREAQRQRDVVNEQLEKLRAELRTALGAREVETASQQAESTKIAVQLCEKRIEQLKSVLGDMAIAMSDYMTITEELASTRSSLRDVRDALEEIISSANATQVSWAQRPTRGDQDDEND